MNIADKLKSNIVVIPVVASIVVGSFTGIKYVLNLTNTINSNKQAIYILEDKISNQNETIKKANQDISNIYGVIQMSKEIMEIMGGQVSDLQWEVRDLIKIIMEHDDDNELLFYRSISYSIFIIGNICQTSSCKK